MSAGVEVVDVTEVTEVRHCMYAYVGSRTTKERNARGEGISVFRVDEVSGELHLVQQVGGLVNPSYLCLNRRQDRLYTVHGDGHEVSVFAVSAVDGTLTFLQRQECGGRNPVHLALDPSERFLILSDHLGNQSGTVVVMPVSNDGALGAVSQRVALPGMPGPHRKEQPHAKPHFNPFDPSGQFVAVPDKGLDRVFVFRFADGQLTPANKPWLDVREGAGPRHITFHPTAPYAYVVNELDSSVLACHFDAQTGNLTSLQVLPSLPSTFTGNSRAAGIAMSRDGRKLYVSNRGHDSIAVFQINLETGLLQFVETTDSLGKTPRFFTLSPNGARMYVLNEDSDQIVVFAVDADTGRLASTGRATGCGSPVCMLFAAA